MIICPFLNAECLREKCALWIQNKRSEYSRCGLQEVARAAKNKNIADAMEKKRREDETPY